MVHTNSKSSSSIPSFQIFFGRELGEQLEGDLREALLPVPALGKPHGADGRAGGRTKSR